MKHKDEKLIHDKNSKIVPMTVLLGVLCGFSFYLGKVYCPEKDRIVANDVAKAVQSSKESKKLVFGARGKSQAWRLDDASRPQSLPNLVKQNYQKLRSSRRATATWARQNVEPQPSSCLICYEDLDPTDSSFLPCPCGFHLCLFCHKRIIEGNARCPGCRKQYEHIKGDLGFKSKVDLSRARYGNLRTWIF